MHWSFVIDLTFYLLMGMIIIIPIITLFSTFSNSSEEETKKTNIFINRWSETAAGQNNPDRFGIEIKKHHSLH